jgi:hypothetical protein
MARGFKNQRRPSELRQVILTVLDDNKCGDFELDSSERSFLRMLSEEFGDDPIWKTVIRSARARGLVPVHSEAESIVWYALRARRLALSLKAGDLMQRDRIEHRNRLLSLAKKADDLARYYHEVEQYSGIAGYIHRFLRLPVTPEQEAVPRIEHTSLRVKQLQFIHEREAEMLREMASDPPGPTTFISQQTRKRSVVGFIHLAAEFMKEFTGQEHRSAIALLASAAFNSVLDNEDVRKALAPSTRTGRKGVRAHSRKKTS